MLWNIDDHFQTAFKSFNYHICDMLELSSFAIKFRLDWTWYIDETTEIAVIISGAKNVTEEHLVLTIFERSNSLQFPKLIDLNPKLSDPSGSFNNVKKNAKWSNSPFRSLR